MTLVLDVGDHSLLGPVDFHVAGVHHFWLPSDCGSLGGNFEGEIGSSELGIGQISELIDAHLPGLGLISVMFLNLDQISQEDGLPVFFFSFLGVMFAKVCLELLEGVDTFL